MTTGLAPRWAQTRLGRPLPAPSSRTALVSIFNESALSSIYRETVLAPFHRWCPFKIEVGISWVIYWNYILQKQDRMFSFVKSAAMKTRLTIRTGETVLPRVNLTRSKPHPEWIMSYKAQFNCKARLECVLLKCWRFSRLMVMIRLFEYVKKFVIWALRHNESWKWML